MPNSTRHYAHWYLLALRGLFLIFFGIYAITIPRATTLEFAHIFEAFTIISGLLLIQNAILNRKTKNWQFVLFNGLLDLTFGVLLWLVPQMDLLDLKIALAIWFLYSGLIQAVDSFVLIHDQVKNWWFELISGMLSIILAFIIIAARIKIQSEVYDLVGVFAIIFGAFVAVSSFVIKDGK